jgi:isovaleryl-CoA dehydrogenase
MLFVNNFYHCSNAEQKARYLPKVLSGEWVAGMGMTEPGAGTDVLAMTTSAVRRGDEYVLTAPRPTSPTAARVTASWSTRRWTAR